MSGVMVKRAAAAALARWAMCGTIVVGGHGAAVLALTRQPPAIQSDETGGAFAVEIAPEAVAPAEKRADAAPGPPAAATAASVATPPPPKSETPPERKPEAVHAPTPLPEPVPLAKAAEGEEAPAAKPDAAPEPPPPAAIAAPAVEATSAPQVVARRTGTVAKATALGAPSEAMVRAMTGWQSRVLDRIERQKRYPSDAAASHSQGVAVIRFSLDRQGRLLDAVLERTSGNDRLDAEALATVRRAAPFPVLPEGAAAGGLSLAVPIRFRLR